jgi:predicted amidohydrolase YtcJ
VSAPTRTWYRHGRIFTADPERPWTESLVVADGMIIYVGDDAQAVEHATIAEVVELEGALVLPGFVDAHTHLIGMGEATTQLALGAAVDLDDVQQRLRAYAAARPEAPRLLGNGWLYPALGDREPRRELLDAVVPDRPVYLAANDQHSSWVNSAALAELGIDADTPDPIGGTIVRDPQTGEATGHLLERASLGLMRDFLDSTVTDGDRDAALAAAFSHYLTVGVTAAVDMGLNAEDLATLERAVSANRLPLRVAGHWLVVRSATTEENLAQVRTAAEHAARLDSPWLKVAGIKIMVDGVIDSCTAAMRAPFSDGSHPGPIWDLESLVPVVTAADAAGLQIAMHAIGDHASAIALDALEAAVAANGPRDRRHRIEHLETVAPDSIERMSRLGVIASMQPVHSDPAIQQNWRAMLGDDRVERGYPWPELSTAGAVVAFGTDAPTAPHPPLPNMFVATTRRSAVNPRLPANLPEYALPLAEAIGHATRDAAYSCRWEGLTGRLSAGLAADLVVLDTDPFTAGPESLLTTTIARTVVGGEVRYSR